MPSYSTDREWSDRFIPEMKRIIGPHLLEVSSFEVDTKKATDLVIMKASGVMIACRVRRPGYDRYRHEFTVRSLRDSGAETELTKIYDGWADWMFYGHADDDCDEVEEPGFKAWSLINLDSFRSQMIKFHSQIRSVKKSNQDGTHFVAFDMRSFKPHPPLLIASSGILTVPDPFQAPPPYSGTAKTEQDRRQTSDG